MQYSDLTGYTFYYVLRKPNVQQTNMYTRIKRERDGERERDKQASTATAADVVAARGVPIGSYVRPFLHAEFEARANRA